ncbi:protein of unknown function [Methylocella tundrae]|uniref:OmpA-like domain-containing protein n=1 Tax=Methylocella tundrae TaxID=227605 RepID=A0A4U8Z2H9_METTU|nr:protein of unknown function [Methylocella tundrae]
MELARAIKEQQPGNVRLVGHTDVRGGPQYNKKLSVARAEAVAAFLKDNEVEVPVEPEGVGADEPLQLADTHALTQGRHLRPQPPRRMAARIGAFKLKGKHVAPFTLFHAAAALPRCKSHRRPRGLRSAACRRGREPQRGPCDRRWRRSVSASRAPQRGRS